jgi:hypothetical protein
MSEYHLLESIARRDVAHARREWVSWRIDAKVLVS